MKKYYLGALYFLVFCMTSYATVLRVPTDYVTLDDAFQQALTSATPSTIVVETAGSHTLGHAVYDSPEESYVTIEGVTTPYAGIFFGHLVGAFQPTGPYQLLINDRTVTVEPAHLEIPGLGTAVGHRPNFSELIPGQDKVIVYTRSSGSSEYSIVHVEQNTITLDKEVSFQVGDGFVIKPRTSVTLSLDHHAVRFAFKGSLSLRSIAFDLMGSRIPHAIFEQAVHIEQCLNCWHIGASHLNAREVVHLGKAAGLELTDSYSGDTQTFLGGNITVYANNYAHGTRSCFIGAEKGIDAGTYGHMVEKDAEFFGCTTAVWIDGGSQVAIPGSWLRQGDRGVRLSANSSCMNSARVSMTQVDLGVRALFNSQFHATSLFLEDVDIHAHIDDQHIVELMPPVQPGVRTLDPDGYGIYHSGMSYNYLTSNTVREDLMINSAVPVAPVLGELSDSQWRSGESFLDAIPSEELTKPFNVKKLGIPTQVHPTKKKRVPGKSKRCSRNCGQAPCDPCCSKKAKCCCEDICKLEKELKYCELKRRYRDRCEK